MAASTPGIYDTIKKDIINHLQSKLVTDNLVKTETDPLSIQFQFFDLDAKEKRRKNIHELLMGEGAEKFLATATDEYKKTILDHLAPLVGDAALVKINAANLSTADLARLAIQIKREIIAGNLTPDDANQTIKKALEGTKENLDKAKATAEARKKAGSQSPPSPPPAPPPPPPPAVPSADKVDPTVAAAPPLTPPPPPAAPAVVLPPPPPSTPPPPPTATSKADNPPPPPPPSTPPPPPPPPLAPAPLSSEELKKISIFLNTVMVENGMITVATGREWRLEGNKLVEPTNTTKEMATRDMGVLNKLLFGNAGSGAPTITGHENNYSMYIPVDDYAKLINLRKIMLDTTQQTSILEAAKREKAASEAAKATAATAAATPKTDTTSDKTSNDAKDKEDEKELGSVLNTFLNEAKGDKDLGEFATKGLEWKVNRSAGGRDLEVTNIPNEKRRRLTDFINRKLKEVYGLNNPMNDDAQGGLLFVDINILKRAVAKKVADAAATAAAATATASATSGPNAKTGAAAAPATEALTGEKKKELEKFVEKKLGVSVMQHHQHQEEGNFTLLLSVGNEARKKELSQLGLDETKVVKGGADDKSAYYTIKVPISTLMQLKATANATATASAATPTTTAVPATTAAPVAPTTTAADASNIQLDAHNVMAQFRQQSTNVSGSAQYTPGHAATLKGQQPAQRAAATLTASADGLSDDLLIRLQKVGQDHNYKCVLDPINRTLEMTKHLEGTVNIKHNTEQLEIAFTGSALDKLLPDLLAQMPAGKTFNLEFDQSISPDSVKKSVAVLLNGGFNIGDMSPYVKSVLEKDKDQTLWKAIQANQANRPAPPDQSAGNSSPPPRPV